MSVVKRAGILVIIPALIIVTTVFLFNFFSYESGVSQESRAMCGTTIRIFFSNSSRFDQTEIIGILRENLSSLTFHEVVGNRPWWDYLSISQPDENGVSLLFIPSVSQDLFEPILIDSFETIHGFSKIEIAWAYCE